MEFLRGNCMHLQLSVEREKVVNGGGIKVPVCIHLQIQIHQILYMDQFVLNNQAKLLTVPDPQLLVPNYVWSRRTHIGEILIFTNLVRFLVNLSQFLASRFISISLI